MADLNPAGVPEASPLLFQNGITHPDLWLWDSWVLRHENALHLYCLALSRRINGHAVLPADRNNHSFHVRHFVSVNDGQSWRDYGPLVSAGALTDGTDARNIWSGSVTQIAPSQFLFCHTGIKAADKERPFLQSINAALSNTPDKFVPPETSLICPERDYPRIREAGYYLDAPDRIGHKDGEENGPIMAWRDPFTFVSSDEDIHLFVSAKIDARTPAIGHALLGIHEDQVTAKRLLPPILLPDAHTYTQAEVPKVYHDHKRDLYYLLISSCNRLYEGQPDAEVKKEHRLYKATDLSGPWAPYHKAGSLLPDLDNLFGASLISADFDTGNFRFIAPYTEMASPQNQLTFSQVRSVNIYAPKAGLAEKLA